MFALKPISYVSEIYYNFIEENGCFCFETVKYQMWGFNIQSYTHTTACGRHTGTWCYPKFRSFNLNSSCALTFVQVFLTKLMSVMYWSYISDSVTVFAINLCKMHSLSCLLLRKLHHWFGFTLKILLFFLRFWPQNSRNWLPVMTITLTTLMPLTLICWQTPCESSSRERVWRFPCMTLQLMADRRNGWGWMYTHVRALCEWLNVISVPWLPRGLEWRCKSETPDGHWQTITMISVSLLFLMSTHHCWT